MSTPLLPSIAAYGRTRPPLAAATAPRPPTRALVETKPKKRARKKGSSRRVQDSNLYNLTLDVHDLKRELNDLARYRELLHSRGMYVPRDPSVAVLQQATTYFQGFARGYAREDCRQTAMVHALADDTLTMGTTGLGVAMLLEQWRRYTELFHVRSFRQHSSEIVSPDGADSSVVVKCHLTLHGVFTRAAIDTVFPGARRDMWLLLRVLGEEMVCPMTFHLYFNRDGRLVRHDVMTDFCSALHRVLDGDSSAVAEFMHGACVGEESMVGRLDHVEPAEDASIEDEGPMRKQARVVVTPDVSTDDDHSLTGVDGVRVPNHDEWVGKGWDTATVEAGHKADERADQPEPVAPTNTCDAAVDRYSLAFLLAPT